MDSSSYSDKLKLFRDQETEPVEFQNGRENQTGNTEDVKTDVSGMPTLPTISSIVDRFQAFTPIGPPAFETLTKGLLPEGIQCYQQQNEDMQAPPAYSDKEQCKIPMHYPHQLAVYNSSNFPHVHLPSKIQTQDVETTADSDGKQQTEGSVVDVYVEDELDYFGWHIALSCCTFWCCGFVFGLVAFVLAVLAQKTKKTDRASARLIGKGSIACSAIGIIIGAAVIITLAVTVLAKLAHSQFRQGDH